MITDLVYASPESVGVRSLDILKFIRYVEENKINLHSMEREVYHITIPEEKSRSASGLDAILRRDFPKRIITVCSAVFHQGASPIALR